nr:endonuclease/exonuclease/phosphatase family protein [Parachlamydiaceae bacterium]
CSLSVIALENSVIPKIEQMENIENLLPVKYSQNQFLEIAATLDHKHEKIRIVSYNTLFNIFDQNLDEINRWPQRLPRIVELLEEMQPDIIGIQELYTDQSIDLLAHIGNTYSFYSTGYENSELNGIFYRTDRFEVVDSYIWNMGDVDEEQINQALTMLKLEDLTTGKCVAVFNAHLAFGKIDKRESQARFIAKCIEPIAAQMPVVLTGDLNTFPNRPDMEKFPFYDGDYIHRILTQGALKDSKEMSVLGHLGPISTFSNLGEDSTPFKGTGTPGVFLDHIYVSKGINVIIHAVQPGTVDGHYPSDHLPVLIDFIIEE